MSSTSVKKPVIAVEPDDQEQRIKIVFMKNFTLGFKVKVLLTNTYFSRKTAKILFFDKFPIQCSLIRLFLVIYCGLCGRL